MARQGGSWDPSKMFDMTQEEMNVIKQRKELNRQNKLEFRRLVMDPSTQGKGGTILDPVMQRWYSGRATFGTYFRPNAKSSFTLVAWFLFPVGFTMYLVGKDRLEREAFYRQGKNATAAKIDRMGTYMM